MFGDTITLDLSLDETPVPIILKKINQDGYSSEYRLKDADREHVLLIRHTKESSKLKGKTVDRHNVTYTQNVFPTEVSPLGETIQAYSVIRANPESSNDNSLPVINAVMAWTKENGDAVLNWES